MSEATEAKGLPAIDVHEYGGKKDGAKQSMNRRLFMQLLVFRVHEGSADAVATGLLAAMRARKVPGVVYADAMDPRSVGLLSWGEDPAAFVKHVRPLFIEGSLAHVELRDDYAMIGRTYGTG